MTTNWADSVRGEKSSKVKQTDFISNDQLKALIKEIKCLGKEAQQWRNEPENLTTEGKLFHEMKREKSPLNGEWRESPVTQKDKEVHEKLSAFLQALTPNIPIVSEEEEDENKNRQLHQNPTYWVMDPIDGTSNFISDKKQYGVLLGLVHDGRPIMGITYYPEYDMLCYTKGGKAFREKDGNTEELHIGEPFRCDSSEGPQVLRITPRVKKAKAQPAALTKRKIDTESLRPEAIDYEDYPDEMILLDGKAQLGSINNGGYEWDIAGRQAIFEAAGGLFVDKKTGWAPQFGRSNPRGDLFVDPMWTGHPKTLEALKLLQETERTHSAGGRSHT